MPTNLDTIAADGTIFRTCAANIAHTSPVSLELNEENFYRRAGRPFETRCQACRRERNREVRRLRAAGNPVRARRRSAARKFGVEIEFIGSPSAVESAMRERGLRVRRESYNHQTRATWKIVPDASIAGGAELVSPPLSGEQGLADLKTACEALNAAGARVNRSCGLHVHHDVSDLDLDAFKRLFRGWSMNQRNTDRLVAASRRGSQWARPLAPHELAHIEALGALETETVRRHFTSYRVDRYRSLNVACFPRYGTVEVRQHQGSTNFKKIAAWIAYGQAFIAAAKQGIVAAPGSTDALLDALTEHGLAADTATYLKGRAAHFTGARA